MANKQVFQTMNGLRGIAALTIAALHFGLSAPLKLQYASIAVDFFFVLSGFVISYSYDERLKHNLSFKEFLVIRLVRLYPLYIAGTIIMILVPVLSYLSKGYVIKENIAYINSIPYALLMLPAPPSSYEAIGYLYPLNAPAWSLFFEIVANIIYALSVRLWTETRILILLSFIATILIFSDQFYEAGWRWADPEMGLLRVFYSFPAGVLIYKFWRRGISFPSIPSPIIAALFLALLMAPHALDAQFSVLLGFPLLVAFAATSEPKGVFLPIFSALGAASYAIYAIHWPLRKFAEAVLSKFGLFSGTTIEIILLILIVPICLIIDNVYDTPVRKYLTRNLLRARVKSTMQSVPG